MTLILATANRDQATLVSDRRLSWNGRLVEDDSNKAGILICQDARVAFAFTGIARADQFEASRWLAEALMAAASPSYLLAPLVERLAERAKQDISKLAVDRTHRRLTVVLVGYSYAYDPPRALLYRVSNFERGPNDTPLSEASDEFTVAWWAAHHPPGECVCLGVSAGSTQAVSKTHTDSLHDLVHTRRPARAIIGRSLKVLEEAAKSPKADHSIGRRATSIVLPSDPQLEAYLEYHSDKVSRRVGGIMHIQARGPPHGVYVVVQDSAAAWDSAGKPIIQVVPKVGRNAPCPCGSGKKFKQCHGT
jgi:SEC-C motif